MDSRVILRMDMGFCIGPRLRPPKSPCRASRGFLPRPFLVLSHQHLIMERLCSHADTLQDASKLRKTSDKCANLRLKAHRLDIEEDTKEPSCTFRRWPFSGV